jgi:hypothetical protein
MHAEATAAAEALATGNSFGAALLQVPCSRSSRHFAAVPIRGSKPLTNKQHRNTDLTAQLLIAAQGGSGYHGRCARPPVTARLMIDVPYCCAAVAW